MSNNGPVLNKDDTFYNTYFKIPANDYFIKLFNSNYKSTYTLADGTKISPIEGTMSWNREPEHADEPKRTDYDIYKLSYQAKIEKNGLETFTALIVHTLKIGFNLLHQALNNEIFPQGSLHREKNTRKIFGKKRTKDEQGSILNESIMHLQAKGHEAAEFLNKEYKSLPAVTQTADKFKDELILDLVQKNAAAEKTITKVLNEQNVTVLSLQKALMEKDAKIKVLEAAAAVTAPAKMEI